MPEITYREALNQALAEEIERDDNVVLLGEEVAQFKVRSDSKIEGIPTTSATEPAVGWFLPRLPMIENLRLSRKGVGSETW